MLSEALLFSFFIISVILLYSSSNQEEMLGSINEKRLQFEDSVKLQEIQSLVIIAQ